MKQTYFIHRKAVKVYGYQIHAVEAESYHDAVRLAKIGKANLDDENLDVLELSDICDVSLPDDRNATTIDMRNVEIAESNPCDDGRASARPVNQVVGQTFNPEQGKKS